VVYCSSTSTYGNAITGRNGIFYMNVGRIIIIIPSVVHSISLLAMIFFQLQWFFFPISHIIHISIPTDYYIYTTHKYAQQITGDWRPICVFYTPTRYYFFRDATSLKTKLPKNLRARVVGCTSKKHVNL